MSEEPTEYEMIQYYKSQLKEVVNENDKLKRQMKNTVKVRIAPIKNWESYYLPVTIIVTRHKGDEAE
jgi:hypothetical protein